MKRYALWVAVFAFLAALLPVGPAAAQGVTSAAVTGRLTDEGGGAVEQAVVTLINTSTGQRYATRSATAGRFNFENVQVGGPYTLEIRALGFAPEQATGLTLALGQRFVRDFALKRTAVEVAGITVTAAADPLRSPARTGAATFVSESLVARLPTLTRNFTDFIETTPQIARSSAAGANNRFNSIQIDGAVNNDLFGLGSTGQPGGQVGAKSITLEAISQYQVLIAPFDVRQGGFAGGLINAVTRRGTNTYHGTAFFDYQNEDLVGKDLQGNKFAQFTTHQWGGSVGGPLIRDRLQFFLAAEQQDRDRPNSGANVGTDLVGATGIHPDSMTRFVSIISGPWSTDPGSFGRVTLSNPNTNLFGRLDWQVGRNHALTLRHNYVKASDQSTSRGSNYSLSSNEFSILDKTNSTVLQLSSTLASRFFNEVILQRQTIRDKRDPFSRFPQVQVTVVSDTGGGGTASRTLIAGAEQFSQANRLDQDIYEFTDNLTFTVRGSHKVTVGTHNEFFHFQNLFISQFTGLWTFTSLANFQAGNASSYARQLPYPGTATPVADFNVRQVGLYVQDVFDVTPHLSVTYGLRADVPYFPDHPRFNPTADSTPFGIDTRVVPSGNILWSPRAGFNYDVTGDRRTVLRGGAGLFSGRPAYVWLSNAYGNSGRETIQLSCANRSATDSAPVFTLDPDAQPTACKNQVSAASSALMVVNYFDKKFRFPQTWKFDLALDQDLGSGFLGSIEGIVSYTTNAMVMRDRNLRPAVSFAADGRPMYGTIGATGLATTNFVDARFDKVLEHFNVGGDRAYSFTVGVQRRFDRGFEVSAFYAHEEVRDHNSLTSSIASSNYAFNPIGGDPNDLPLGRSSFEIPHKLTLTGTMNLPYHVQLSLSYVGRTGSPYSYIYQGDANADGYPNRSGSIRGENDLVYVPRNSADITLLSPAADSARLNAYINGEACLRENRGRILPRNACSEPWRHLINLRLTGSLPTLAGQNGQIVFEVFNFLNLLDGNWGLQRNATNPTVRLLQIRGWDATNNRGIFSFVAPNKNPVDNTNSRWRMQLGMKYTF